jgi:hypothetical protein
MEPFKKENRPGCAFTARIADEAFGMCRRVLDSSNKKIDDGILIRENRRENSCKHLYA